MGKILLGDRVFLNDGIDLAIVIIKDGFEDAFCPLLLVLH
jgi:hypothetical protein